MVHGSVLDDSAKTACLGKILFFSYGLKCSQLIRLKYSVNISISGNNNLIFSVFLHEVSWLIIFVGCGQLSPSSKILDHQFLWKKSSDILDFVHGDNHQWKVESETTTLIGCGQWSVVPLIQSNCIILWSSISLEEINWYVRFFVWR